MALAMKKIPKNNASIPTDIMPRIGTNITPTMITRTTKYTKNIIQNNTNKTIGVVIITTIKKNKSVIIVKGTPTNTNNPNIKNAPNIVKTINADIAVSAINPNPKPTIPLKNTVATATIAIINKLGKKKRAEGIACNTKSMNVRIKYKGRKIIIGINVRRFQPHQSGQVSRVIGHIKAFSISPIGIGIIKFNGQKFQIIPTSCE